MNNSHILSKRAEIAQNIVKSYNNTPVAESNENDLNDESKWGFTNEDLEKAVTDHFEKADSDTIEKGGKGAVMGEKRMFGGREYIKTANGWKFHGKGTGAKAQEHAAAHASKKGDGSKKKLRPITDEERADNETQGKALDATKKKQSTVASRSGMSEKEYDKLHPVTKKQLEEQDRKNQAGGKLSQEESFYEGYSYTNQKKKGYDVGKKPKGWNEHHEAGSKAAEEHDKVGLSDNPTSAYEEYENDLYEKEQKKSNKKK